MKIVNLKKIKLAECIKDSQLERIVIVQDGKPVALLVGVKGKDLEQIELGHSNELWTLIEERRKQKTITRAELERRLEQRSKLKRKRLPA